MMMITEVSRSEHSELCTTAVAGTPGWESRAACSDATGGVWGGQLFVGGKVVHFKRARGRPPKNPRPEEHLPKVPIPEHLRERLSA